MANGYDSYLTIYKNDGWYGTGTSSPLVPVLESESLKANRITSERNSTARNTRSQLPDSFVNTGEHKPEGEIEIIPKLEDIPDVLMSHFQVVDLVETGSSFFSTYTPSKNSPTYSGLDLYGQGQYGTEVRDVFSLDIKRSFVGNRTGGTSNVQHFQRGVCNKLSFSNQINEDFKIKCDYKFKSIGFLDSPSSFGDSNVGSYSSGKIMDWSHGTWSVSFITGAGTSTYTELSSINVDCNNNLVEKKQLGNLNRNFFDFGNYTVKGQVSLEYIDDKFFEEWQSGSGFMQLHGTVFDSESNNLTITLPYCLLKPFEKNMGQSSGLIEADFNFEAYERNGTSPISIGLNTSTKANIPIAGFWDAGSTSRVLSEYDFADAGSTSRILSEYDFADRDL